MNRLILELLVYVLLASILFLWFRTLIRSHKRISKGDNLRTKLFALYLINCAGWAVGAFWVTAPSDIERLFLIDLPLSPIAVPFLGWEAIHALTQQEHELLYASLLILGLSGFLLSTLLPLRLAYLTAATAPTLCILASIFVQAPHSNALVRASLDDLQASCVSHTPFAEYMIGEWPQDLFHTVARKGEDYYNWSYATERWSLVESSHLEYAKLSKC